VSLVYKKPRWKNIKGRFHRVNLCLNESCHTDLYDIVGNAIVWERTIEMAFRSLRRIITDEFEIRQKH
jgi:hypothetical protein